MFDFDVVIVGGGPAGLVAGTHLGRRGRRVLVLERELFGGNLKNVDTLAGQPGLPDGADAGAELASRMAEEAQAAGAQLREAEVTEVEAFSSTRWVGCADGRGYSAAVVVAASGTSFRKLGVPGEEEFLGRGVIDCVPCDGGLFLGRTVAVCGSGDHALSDALYLAKLAGRVIVLAEGPALQADAGLRERALAEPRIEVRCGVAVRAVLGSDRVEGLALTGAGEGETLPVEGVAVRVGSLPNSDFLADVVDLDPEGRVLAGEALETSRPLILAVGDIRTGSPGQVAAAIRDGEAAARTAERLLSLST
jgi:thioredoxin reductase (NADPH)